MMMMIMMMMMMDYGDIYDGVTMKKWASFGRVSRFEATTRVPTYHFQHHHHPHNPH